MNSVPATLPFPSDPQRVLREHGKAWMKLDGVQRVGLAWLEGRLHFVISTDDPAIRAQVPKSIGGYPTAIESGRAKAASGSAAAS
jgi:hypothetical protein